MPPWNIPRVRTPSRHCTIAILLGDTAAVTTRAVLFAGRWFLGFDEAEILGAEPVHLARLGHQRRALRLAQRARAAFDSLDRHAA